MAPILPRVREARIGIVPFDVCHPALGEAARVALTLRLLGGLTAAGIAHASFVPEATMAQRLVRAKAKIRDAQSRPVEPRRGGAGGDRPCMVRRTVVGTQHQEARHVLEATGVAWARCSFQTIASGTTWSARLSALDAAVWSYSTCSATGRRRASPSR